MKTRFVAILSILCILFLACSCISNKNEKSSNDKKALLSELSDDELLAVFADYGIELPEDTTAESLRKSVKTCEDDPEAYDSVDYSKLRYELLDVKYAIDRYNGLIDESLPTPLSHLGEKGCEAKLKELGVTIPEGLRDKNGAYVKDLRKYVIELEKDINTENRFEDEGAEVYEALRAAVKAYGGK